MARPEGSTRLDDGRIQDAESIRFEVPADAPERDLRRVQQEVDTAERNALIKRQYQRLKSECTHQKAFQILADRHNTSTRTVRRVVWGG